jgi:hypothetical protein
LNEEFWNDSREPEVIQLQREILTQFFHGIIRLETDAASSGVYGYAQGAALTRHLLRPALVAAGQLLPRNEQGTIGGVVARDGVIQGHSHGALSAPSGAHPRPFEITLVLPKSPPESLKESAVILSLKSILEEYRRFISYAADL